jgi:hypothetical protein
MILLAIVKFSTHAILISSIYIIMFLHCILVSILVLRGGITNEEDALREAFLVLKSDNTDMKIIAVHNKLILHLAEDMIR